jgi:hypothetical protein
LAGKVLDLDNIILKDDLGCAIANMWRTWNMLRNEKMLEWEEVRKYVFAVDTTKTTNSQLPWKNKTTIPKLCQIRDNLAANYMAAMFPKRKWVKWVADERDSNTKEKRETIESYMCHAIEQPGFKEEIEKLVLDYIDYGNVFATVEWVDNRVEQKDKSQVGYVGPAPRRISPLDIVMNPVAPSFEKSPKIVRSLVSMGEVKEILERLTTNENRAAYEELFDYMVNLRLQARHSAGAATELRSQNELFNIDGFTNFQSYLQGDYVELLTFYGDIYDYETKTYFRNHVIMVADRHKVLSKGPNPSYFGTAPIFHVGWRKRQDNLWAMGPLDNLVGMQYRIDHLENLKADCFDLIAFPPLKIKGYVQDFQWGPFAKIFIGDDGSDVEVLQIPFQVLQTNSEIEILRNTMEEMAGSPKEAMGFRSPGEKTKYEVQRLENASGRIFQSKGTQFEERLTEKLLNAMLELGRRNISSEMDVSVFDDEFRIQTFVTLQPKDLIGNGSIRPIAARHFAEQAERIQNLTAFFNSPIGQDEEVKSHFSSLKVARMMEELLDIQEYELVLPHVRLAERAEAQKIANAQLEQVLMEAGVPSGISPDDSDQPFTPQPGTPPGGAIGPTGSMGQAPASPGY